jgi:hypothetical protein
MFDTDEAHKDETFAFSTFKIVDLLFFNYWLWKCISPNLGGTWLQNLSVHWGVFITVCAIGFAACKQLTVSQTVNHCE